MGMQTDNDDSDRVDAAFNRVLAAEAEARQRVEECRRETSTILAAAEARARRITRRTDQRVQLAHRLADAQVAQALSGLLAEDAAKVPTDLDADMGPLDRAIATLADEILAPTPDA